MDYTRCLELLLNQGNYFLPLKKRDLSNTPLPVIQAQSWKLQNDCNNGLTTRKIIAMHCKEQRYSLGSY